MLAGEAENHSRRVQNQKANEVTATDDPFTKLLGSENPGESTTRWLNSTQPESATGCRTKQSKEMDFLCTPLTSPNKKKGTLMVMCPNLDGLASHFDAELADSRALTYKIVTITLAFWSRIRLRFTTSSNTSWATCTWTELYWACSRRPWRFSSPMAITLHLPKGWLGTWILFLSPFFCYLIESTLKDSAGLSWMIQVGQTHVHPSIGLIYITQCFSATNFKASDTHPFCPQTTLHFCERPPTHSERLYAHIQIWFG